MQAKECEALLNMSLQKSLCAVTTDTKEKSDFVKKNFERIDDVFDRYIELVTFKRKETASEDKATKESQPVIDVKKFFEQEVLNTMASQGKAFTVGDIVSSIGKK